MNDNAENKTSHIYGNVSRNINAIEEISYSLRAFFFASEYVDSDEFRLVSKEILTRHKYISSISYLKKVKGNMRSDFELRMVDDGFINLSFKEKYQKTYSVSNIRKMYYPLIYIAPFTPLNVKKIGYDYLSDESYTTFIEHAVSSGRLTASSDEKNSYVIFIAIYAGKDTPTTSSDRKNR